jgi:hypothetical protein
MGNLLERKRKLHRLETCGNPKAKLTDRGAPEGDKKNAKRGEFVERQVIHRGLSLERTTSMRF